jgi:hypothetical protein
MSNEIPKVSIGFSKNNLLSYIPLIDGVGILVGTGLVVGNQNKVFIINGIDDAVTQGITLAAEPAAYRQLSEFYGELGGKQTCYLLLLPNTVTLAEMIDPAIANHANLLLASTGGTEGYLAIFKSNPVGYDPGADFMDQDVAAAVAMAKTFVTYWNDKLRFFRVIIEGRVADETKPTIYAPNIAANGFAQVVLGGSMNDGSASVGAALARKVKYPCHIKTGKVANGPLALQNVYIGTKLLKDVANLITLHGLGYNTFITYPDHPGVYFGIDNMASNDDFKIMVHGAVCDAVARVARSVYVDDLEGEVDANPDGTITEEDAKHLEDTIELKVNSNLASRISKDGFKCIVDRSVNIINTNSTVIQLSVRPKGYKTFINVTIGLTA